MKIAILSLNYYPELTGIGVYNHDFAVSLVEEGHDVTVVCTYPYYPQWKRDPRYRPRLFMREQIGKVDVVRCLTYIPERLTSLKRVLHEGIFSLLAIIELLFSARPDVLFAVSPPFLGIVVAAVVGRVRRIPIHIHVQDLQPDTAIDLGMLKGRVLVGVLYRLERFAYNVASSISCIGEGMLLRLRSKGIPPKKTLLFRNWANLDSDLRTRTFDPASVRERLSLDGKYVVLHAGNMGKKQALDVLIETATLSQEANDDILFLLVGDGATKAELEQMVVRKDLTNVRFLGVQSKEQFADILRAADLSVVLQRVQVRDIVLPSKILNILAAGCPVIASVHQESETASVLRELTQGLIVEPENPRALYERIHEFKSKDRASIRALRQQEQALAKRYFSKDLVIPPMIEQLTMLAERRA